MELAGKVKQRSCGLDLLHRDQLTAAAALRWRQIKPDSVPLEDVLPERRKRMFLGDLPSEADDTKKECNNRWSGHAVESQRYVRFVSFRPFVRVPFQRQSSLPVKAGHIGAGGQVKDKVTDSKFRLAIRRKPLPDVIRAHADTRV